MAIVYVPRLIESAEQAEALPIGTVTLPPARHRGNAVATVKGRDELWRETGSEQPFTDVEMVDEIALVPIEAEEEKRSVARHPGGGQTNYNTEAAGNPGRMGEYIASLPVESRFVTPWEAV